MAKQIHSFTIGGRKKLVLEVEADNETEVQFAKDCAMVSENKPSTIQEFFTQLVELQTKKNNEKIVGNDNGRRTRR